MPLKSARQALIISKSKGFRCYCLSARGTISIVAKKKIIEDREELEKLAPVMKAPINRHVFVCNGKSCSKVGSSEVKAEFERILESKRLRQGKEKKGRNPMGPIALTDCGSVGFCSIGVAVLVYPEGVWYGQVQAEDVPEIIEEHLEKGNVVDRLALIEMPCCGNEEA
jgi:(2Fe-2S) ferredoxin